MTSVESDRVVSIDVLRGVLVVAMIAARAVAWWRGPVTVMPAAGLAHVGWTGVDLVYPGFVFVVGVSIVLTPRTRGPLARIAARIGRLLAIGVVISLLPRPTMAAAARLTPLTRLAVDYAIAVLVYRAVARRDEDARLRIVGGLTIAAIAGAWALQRFVIAPERAALAAGGVLTAVAALGCVFAGVMTGVLLMGSRSAVDKTAALVVIGGLTMAAAIGWDARWPIVPAWWTSSFVLLACGAGGVAAGSAHWLVDARGRASLVRPVAFLGRHALVIYVVLAVVVAFAGTR